MLSWSKYFAKDPQTHESLLPEKIDARAATNFAEHQANYYVASHVCFVGIFTLIR